MVRMNKPDVEAFLEELVTGGRFPTREAAVEAAVERMMMEESELDEETLASIERAEEQIARGEGIPFEQVANELRAKYGLK